MPTNFVVNEIADEEILFAVFGELKANQDPKKSILVKEGETLTGVVMKISDSPTYKKVYRLKVNKIDKPVVVTGKTDLLDKMGHGVAKTDRVVKENDLVQITYNGMTKTSKGRDFYSFTVAIAE